MGFNLLIREDQLIGLKAILFEVKIRSNDLN